MIRQCEWLRYLETCTVFNSLMRFLEKKVENFKRKSVSVIFKAFHLRAIKHFQLISTFSQLTFSMSNFLDGPVFFKSFTYNITLLSNYIVYIISYVLLATIP